MKNNQQGQSTIEFIFSFVFAVSLVLMVFNTSVNYVSGYVAHYATYMASRVLMTQDVEANTWGPGQRGMAVAAAKDTFRDFRLDIFGITEEVQVNDDTNVDASGYLMVGVYFPFKKKMDIVGRVTGQTELELISESFLGHEPTRSVCASRVCRAITGQDECTGGRLDITLFDDGC